MNRAITVLLVSIALVLAGACGGEPVGRICDLGVEAPPAGQSVVASPSLDCTTRTCLKVPKTNTTPPEGSRYPEGNKSVDELVDSRQEDMRHWNAGYRGLAALVYDTPAAYRAQVS